MRGFLLAYLQVTAGVSASGQLHNEANCTALLQAQFESTRGRQSIGVSEDSVTAQRQSGRGQQSPAPEAQSLSVYVPGSDGTYSQNYQDVWISSVAQYNGWTASGGFFLDLGAFHGLKCSNSALVEKTLGWQGVCVEPRPLPGAFLGRTCSLVQRPLSDTSNKAVALAGSAGSQAQHTVEQALAGHQSPGGVMMMTLSMNDLLMCLNSTFESSVCAGVPRGLQVPLFINFISLDVEGQDAKVLSTFPFDRIQVGAWVVEVTDGRNWVSSILTQNGYMLAPVENPGVDQYFIQPRFWNPILAKKLSRVHPPGSEDC
mmetsp:Transcript_41552/g.73020  ORF Transcript_41552/g.73020 Transcript_41552/m.73020 type:complete len:315 (+) Transcript_41552:94-1038(+)